MTSTDTPETTVIDVHGTDVIPMVIDLLEQLRLADLQALDDQGLAIFEAITHHWANLAIGELDRRGAPAAICSWDGDGENGPSQDPQ
jgi:hypothetical protein